MRAELNLEGEQQQGNAITFPGVRKKHAGFIWMKKLTNKLTGRDLGSCAEDGSEQQGAADEGCIHAVSFCGVLGLFNSVC